MFEVAKVYIRSIVGIAATSVVLGYGMYVGVITGDQIPAYLTACVAMVLLDEKTRPVE